MTADAPPQPTGTPAAPVPDDGLPDVTPQALALDSALTVLLDSWVPIAVAQKTSLVGQVGRVLAEGRIPTEADLVVDTTAAKAELHTALIHAAGEAGELVVDEARSQGITVTAVQPSAGGFADTVTQVTGELADQLTTTAAAAIESTGPGSTADETTTVVTEALDGLPDGAERTSLGGALHGAMNTGRAVTLSAGPVGAVYSSERNDPNTCSPCHEIDGRWLGNTDDMAMVEASYPGGAHGGYIGCLGGVRCRGTIVGVWRKGANGKPKKTPKPQAPAPAEAEPTPVIPTEPEPEVAEPAEMDLADHIAGGVRSTEILGGGMAARTELVTFNDGAKAVRKTVLNDDVRDRVEMQDAEELSALYAHALGIPAPAVVRTGDAEIYMDYVDSGVTGMERYTYDVATDPDVRALADADAGRRLGLFDLAVGNVDRNSGNWLIGDGGQLTAIDHGYAFVSPAGDAGLVMEMVTGPNNVFAHRLLDFLPGGDIGGTRNYSRADVAHLQEVLGHLRPEFDRLNRSAWLTETQQRLAAIAPYAQADGSVF